MRDGMPSPRNNARKVIAERRAIVPSLPYRIGMAMGQIVSSALGTGIALAIYHYAIS